MKITKLFTNWGVTKQCGESYQVFELGINNVINITEHKAAYDGDKWYYDIEYSDGRITRCFNPDQAIYENDK